MAIQQINLLDVSIPSGTYDLTAKSSAPGLATSDFSNEVTFDNEYLNIYFDSKKGVYEVYGIQEDYIDQVTEVVIPETRNGYPVTTIVASAFSGTFIKKVVIPKSIKRIGRQAFSSCQHLTDIEFEHADVTYYFRNNLKWTDLRGYCYNTHGTEFNGASPGNTLKYVRSDGQYDIYSITVPSGCTCIEISGLKNGERIVAPVININDTEEALWHACCYEMDLRTMNGIQSITFGKCDFEAPDSDFLIMDEGVFQHCRQLRYIGLPHTLKYIPDKAFIGTSISMVAVPRTSAWRGIGASAFEDTSVDGIYIPPTIEYIGNRAFANCESLSRIYFGTGFFHDNHAHLKTIGDYAFEGSGLVTINIPSTVNGIGEHAFASCTNLKWAVIQGSGFIGDYAFAYCNKLDMVVIGDPTGYHGDTGYPHNTLLYQGKITSIGSYAFAETAIKTLTIPPSLTWIGVSVFDGVTALKDVIFASETVAANTGWFYTTSSAPEGGTYIPAEELEDSSTALRYLTTVYKNYYWYRIDKLPAPELSLNAALLSIKDESGLAQEFTVYVDGQVWFYVDAQSGDITRVEEIETEAVQE